MVASPDENNAQLRVPDADSPAAEPAKPREHSVWSSDSESESESDGECWCMECFKSRIMGWDVPHADKFVVMKQASLRENQIATATPTAVPAVVTATAEAQDSEEIAGMTSVSSEMPTPEDRHAGAMATMESAVPGTASVITEGPDNTTTETASIEALGHVSTGTAMSAPLITPGKASLSDSTATATVPQPMAPLTQEDHITLEEALATLVASEREDSPKTAGKVSTKRKTPAQESSEVKKNTEGTSSSGSQEEWFRVFLDGAFGDFRPVSPTGSLHSSLFGSSKSELSQEETGSTGNGKVRSSTGSTLSSASSAQSSKDTGDSNGRKTVAKKRVQSSSDTSSSKGGRDSGSTTTSSGPLSSSDKSRRPGKRIGSKKSETSSDKTGRGYSTSSTTTPSSVLSDSDKSRRGGQKTGSKKRARSSSSDTSSSKRGLTSTGTSTSTSNNSLTRNDKKSRRAGKRTAPKKRARSSSDGKSARTRGRASISTSYLPPSKKRRTQNSPDIKPYKTTYTKPSDQNKLISMYYSCEPIDFFAPDEKRDDGEDGYETPWNFGVTPNLSLSRSDGGLWHSCKPVRSLSRPPPLPPPLYRPRPPWLEDVEDSPPPTSPGSPRHPDYPLRFGATGRSQPTRFYTAPYRRVGVLEHVGSPLQSTSTCPDHMVARYQNYLWIEPYDWSGTDMCDMFDATELR